MSNNLNELKQEYNYNLKRLFNGEKYLEEYQDEIDRWIPEIEKIIYILSRLLEEIEKYQKVSKKELWEGFEDV